MAQAFSSALDSAFSLDSDVDHLSQTIDQKYVQVNKPNSFFRSPSSQQQANTPTSRKQQMMIQTRELEALQQRIREAEERLKGEQNGSQTHGGEDQSAGKDDSA